MSRKHKKNVRVLSGEYGGRVLAYPDSRGVRPTMQRTKSSVFESLGDRIHDAVFVDLYAGAGGMGIEALSRGAALVHFVERDREALTALRSNLDMLAIPASQAAIHACVVQEFIEGGSAGGTADIVFADPPYDDAGLLLEFLAKVDYPHNGIFVFEHRSTLDVAGPGWQVVRQRRFGETTISYLEINGGNDS